MTHIDASQLDYRQLNAAIRDCAGDVAVTGCLGQRFIGAGRGHDRLTITGTPGNALGAYLDGACIEVRGDAQDAVGDTMNAGRIIVHGSIGDAAGYAMRGGELYVAGNAGYRAGIHMKAYGDKLPAMVMKVVRPARISVLTVVPFSFRWKMRSIVIDSPFCEFSFTLVRRCSAPHPTPLILTHFNADRKTFCQPN